MRQFKLSGVLACLGAVVLTSCVEDTSTQPESAMSVIAPMHFVGDEEEVYGNIYAGGEQDTSSYYYVTLVPADEGTASRLVGTYDSIVYQTHNRTWAFGWFDPAETDSGRCGTLETYLDPETSDSARGDEIHAVSPGEVGGGKEAHCIRPGRYWIALRMHGEPTPLRAFEIDYVQLGGYASDTTSGAPSGTLLVENTAFDPEEERLADNIFHFDLSSGAFVDSAVLQIDTARANPLTKPFGNDSSPSGLHTDWFRFGGQRSTSTWTRPGSGGGNVTLQGRLFYDYARQSGLRSGYYSIYPSASGAPVLRVYQYQGHLPGDTSAVVEVGFETKRPDEQEATVPDAIREIEVIVGSPPVPPDTAINHFAMPYGVLEQTYSWKMADQYLNGMIAETGPNRTYSWRINQGSWVPMPNGILDFEGFPSAGSNTATLSVYNSAIDSTHYYIGTVETEDSIMYMWGEEFITVKTTHTYNSNRDGIWAERDSFPEAWNTTLTPATDTYNRIWAAGDYVVDLRVQDTTSSMLRRGRLHVTVCIVSQSCGASFGLMAGGVQEPGADVLFGGGPIISWGNAADPFAVRYYELTGRHDGQTPFRGQWWRSAEGGTAGERMQGGAVQWAPGQGAPSRARVVDFTVTPPANQAYAFGLSLDPDLGGNAADDVSGYDPGTGMLYVFDGNEAAGFLLLRDGRNAIAGVTQYGVRRPPPASNADTWHAQRRTGVDLLDGTQDVQFIVSAQERAGVGEFKLVILRAANVASLRATAAAFLTQP